LGCAKCRHFLNLDDCETSTIAYKFGEITGDIDRNIAHEFRDRQPIGGYMGYVVLAPHGVKPEPPPAEPERPGEGGENEDRNASTWVKGDEPSDKHATKSI
jgi:hypothetical protein